MKMKHTLNPPYPTDEITIQWKISVTADKVKFSYRVNTGLEWHPFIELNEGGNISTWFSTFDIDTKAKITEQLKAVYKYV